MDDENGEPFAIIYNQAIDCIGTAEMDLLYFLRGMKPGEMSGDWPAILAHHQKEEDRGEEVRTSSCEQNMRNAI